MTSDRAPSLIREEIFGFDDIAYNAEFDDRGIRLPDLLAAYRAEFDNSETRTEDLTRRFDPQLDDIYSNHHILGYLLTRSPRKFSIPSFQRPYSWDTGEHTEFWLDLIDDLSTVSSGHRIPEMYMGSIYLSSNGSEYDIIDGQQRMITFFVILKVVHKYMCILSDNEDSQFWDVVDEVCSEDGVLEDILYREDGSPALKPKSDDIPYFRLLFKDSPHDIIEAVDEIEFQEDSQTWLIETILVEKLGLRQDNIEEMLEDYSVTSKSHKYYGTPHQRILRANRFYLDNIGEYIEPTLGLNDSINVRGVEADDTTVQARVTTKGTPVADAHISLVHHGDIVRRKESDKYGLVRFDYDELEGEKEIRAEKFGEDDSISFEDNSDFNTERLFVKDINERDGRIRILVIEDGGPVEDRTIEIDNNNSTTTEEGIAEFDISDIAIDEDESLKIRGEADRITVSDLDSLSDYIVEKRTVDPEESARVLLNLTQVLLHSMRTVVIELNMDDPEYKIDVFQSLNDKGRDLDLADIIRARIIGTDDSLSERWEQIYRRHEQDSGEIEDLLENYLIATQGVDSASKNDIKALFNTSRPGNEDIDSELYENPGEFLEKIDVFSKRYREILDHEINDLDDINGLHHDSTVENALKRKWERIIGRLDRGVKVWEPFILLVHKRFAEQDHHGEELIEILKTVEKIIHRYSFYGEDISSTLVSPLFPEACRQYQSGRIDPFDPDEVRDSILIPNVPSELRGEQVLSQLVTKDNYAAKHCSVRFGVDDLPDTRCVFSTAFLTDTD
jgi:uncharacterized protein with ParB-like and HNH nuclease domain